MAYLVTGGTGFIGRFLVDRLLARGETVHCLVRQGSEHKLEALRERTGVGPDRLRAVAGDLTEPLLGVDDEAREALRGEIDHVFHLAAIYDLEADPAHQRRVNVEGTRHAVQLARDLGAGCFHHVSSIAAAGRYAGRFTEEMFEQATGLEHAYFKTKHQSEKVVREVRDLPWRIYRPGIVVGHSRTGEMDKIDGPYHFFPTIKRLRSIPDWLPLLGVEGGRAYLVPVDVCADVIDHVAHQPGWDGKTFHVVEPDPPKVGETVNAFLRAAGAPTAPVRVDARAIGVVPRPLRTVVGALPPVHRALNTLRYGLGIPKEPLSYLLNPTRFDTRNTQEALAGSGITFPRIDAYADVLWEYWERNLQQDVPGLLAKRDRVGGRVALVTGASSGIGLEAAKQLAARGATVLLVARSREDLETLRKEIEEEGGTAFVHPGDLSDLDDVERLVTEVLTQHRRVDILVNNAGMSIRRSVELSYDRMHDYQRTMQLNYFGAVRLTLGLLPGMRERGYGHIVNVSSIGVQTNQPRFSAYVASKSALDAFSRSIATEITHDGVAVTTIYMPLVRTPMIAPTSLYRMFPALSPEEAGEMIVEAVERRPKRVATTLGTVGEVAFAAAPKALDALMNFGFNLFPDSAAARGDAAGSEDGGGLMPERRAFAYLFRGIHW
jgi:NAD(P)-dependent dehydrogenase (short-subunit alcohol dehydrogenase family)